MGSDYWSDDSDPVVPAVADDVVDLAFPLYGATLPVDHAWELGERLRELLPWLGTTPCSGLHLVHAAASGNGWISPEDGGDGLLYLSRRSRLTLRLPSGRVDEANRIAERVIEVAGHRLILGHPVRHLLSPLTTLNARHVVDDGRGDEAEFMARTAAALRALGLRCPRMLCGRSGRFAFPEGPLLTRSLMLAELDFDASQYLQRHGLGPGRGHGFGLFVPHKAIGGG